MIVKMNAGPFLRESNTRATTAMMIAKKVVTTAASCGLLPNGAATKNDQLARVRPKMICTMTISPMLDSVHTRRDQTTPATIQAGRYVNEMLKCHDLRGWVSDQFPHKFVCRNSQDAGFVEKTHCFHVSGDEVCPFRGHGTWELVGNAHEGNDTADKS